MVLLCPFLDQPSCWTSHTFSMIFDQERGTKASRLLPAPQTNHTTTIMIFLYPLSWSTTTGIWLQWWPGIPPPLSPPTLGLSASTFFLMMSHTGGKLYLPPSLLMLGLWALMYMASFTSLSNHLGSVVNTSVFCNSTECWGWSTWMCFETSEVIELDHQCSLNLASGIFLSH